MTTENPVTDYSNDRFAKSVVINATTIKSPVAAKLDEMTDALNNLKAEINRLGAELAPVLNPVDTDLADPSDLGERPERSELWYLIDDDILRVNQLAIAVNALRNRVEI